jgi:predicted lipoprotein with Yx(FWY)xxD motif
MRGLLPIAVAAAALALAAGSGAAASHPPVVKLVAAGFGDILARPDHQALYFWSVEKRDHRVHCTGTCARAWPPLIVRSRAVVPRRVAGIRGTFGVVKRPDGRLQVTHDRLPLYTYAHERPDQVLCDDVDGWFVVRV